MPMTNDPQEAQAHILNSPPPSQLTPMAEGAQPGGQASGGSAYLQRRLLRDLVRSHALGPQVVSLDQARSGSQGSVDTLLAFEDGTPRAGWKEELADSARLLRPDGRLLVEYRSAEHRQAAPVASLPRSADPARHAAPAIAVADLVAAAADSGLSVLAVVPYGAFLCDGSHSRFLGAVPAANYWRRLLSWLPLDVRLLELALLIEQDLIAHLSPRVTERFVAVLQKRADLEPQRDWLRQHQDFDASLQTGRLDWTRLGQRLPRPLPVLRQHIAALLTASMRCRRLFEALAAPLVSRGMLTWHDLLEPSQTLAAYFDQIARYRQLDRLAMDWSRQAGVAVPEVSSIFQHADVPIGAALEYSLVEPLLTSGFGRFTGVRS